MSSLEAKAMACRNKIKVNGDESFIVSVYRGDLNIGEFILKIDSVTYNFSHEYLNTITVKAKNIKSNEKDF